MDLTTGEWYGNKTFSEIKEIYLKLMDAGATAEMIKLLTLVEHDNNMYYFV